MKTYTRLQLSSLYICIYLLVKVFYFNLWSYDLLFLYLMIMFQHASSDVEKMILGNKCDMNDKRQISKERGEAVSTI